MSLNALIFLGIYAFSISAEAIYSHRKKLGLYQLSDTWTSITLGVLGVLTRVFTKAIGLAIWGFFYNLTPFKIESTWYTWILLFILNDFVYYWFHRVSHGYRLFWATHVNHHSSAKFNFSTATRTPFLNAIYHNLFWIPLPLMGFEPSFILSVELVGFLLAFFQHTTIVPKLPVIDWFLNTPSHHRVHHATNPKYLNKNFGNVLIVFDRMFGTFVPEDINEKPIYGITTPLPTNNFFTVIFHEWRAMAADYKPKIKALLGL